jgi:hypothetical protein
MEQGGLMGIAHPSFSAPSNDHLFSRHKELTNTLTGFSVSDHSPQRQIHDAVGT